MLCPNLSYLFLDFFPEIRLEICSHKHNMAKQIRQDHTNAHFQNIQIGEEEKLRRGKNAGEKMGMGGETWVTKMLSKKKFLAGGRWQSVGDRW